MNQSGQGRRAKRARHDGVLLLDKPQGLTSNGALMRARRVLGGAKGGHGGTLDPMATGLLPLLFGEATKFAHGLLDADKTYLAELTLGVRTDTGDAQGEPIDDRSDRVNAVTRDRLDSVLTNFVGDIEQVPPMYSALKRDGKPLYAYAREGVVLERAPRQIRIESIELIEFDSGRVTIRVRCSKGTYIRTLAEDIGEQLGCGAHLSRLRREQVGTLGIGQTITLDAFEALGSDQAPDRLASVDSLLGGMGRIDLDAEHAARFRNGQRLRIEAAGPSGTEIETRLLRVYAPDEILLGVAEYGDGLLAPSRLIATPDQTSNLSNSSISSRNPSK